MPRSSALSVSEEGSQDRFMISFKNSLQLCYFLVFFFFCVCWRFISVDNHLQPSSRLSPTLWPGLVIELAPLPQLSPRLAVTLNFSM